MKCAKVQGFGLPRTQKKGSHYAKYDTKDDLYRRWLQKKALASLEKYRTKRREFSKLCRKKKRRFKRERDILRHCCP